MTGEAPAAKESTGGRREQCNIVAMPETSPARKTSTCHKTVRSGTIYDFDMQERRRESLERAERLKAELGDEPITGTDDRIAYRFVKRVFDFAFSAAVLVLLSWLFVIIAILVKVDDPKGPVFFKQTRVGKNGREFEMLKFRSMCVDAEEKLADLKELNEKTGPVFKIAEDPRITRVGKWLRKLSLASVIIGTPGAGEPTNSLSSAAKTSFDQQFYDRHPEVSPATQSIIPAPNSCLFTFFGGSRKAQYELEARADGADQGGSPWRGKASSSMIEKGAYCLTPALGVAA